MFHSAKFALCAAACLSFTACTPATPQDSDAPATAQMGDDAPYRASGTEPFWSLTIDGTTIIFQPMEGDATIVRNVVARPSLNGWRYTSDSVSVDVTHRECNDGMSDATFKDTVTVLVGTSEYRGCGGARLPDVSLVNTQWDFVTLNGKLVTTQEGSDVSRAPGITFGRNLFGVYSGCNGGGGLYVSGDRWIQAGPITATEMGCDPALMAQEKAASSLLYNAEWWIDGEGFLILKSATSNARLRRAEWDQAADQPRLDPKWENRRWNVASLNSNYQSYNAYGNSPFMVSFANGRLSAKVGCNQISGEYSVDGNALVVGPLSATRMACAPELMERDEQFVALIQSRPKFAMSPNRDVLIGNKAGVMILQGTRAADEPEK
jgi:heat shock protein HslJ